MAEHVVTAEQIDDSTSSDEAGEVDEHEADDVVEPAEKPSRWRLSNTHTLIAIGLVIVAALGGLAGWFGYRSYQAREAQALRNQYVQVARQAAVNLTTISYTEVDADIARILNSATGTFHDDFQKRSVPFVEIVKQVQSKSEGTVAEAGLESASGDQAQVLVAVSMKISTAAAPEQDPRRWRWRISLQKTADGPKVSNVVFVP